VITLSGAHSFWFECFFGGTIRIFSLFFYRISQKRETQREKERKREIKRNRDRKRQKEKDRRKERQTKRENV
jgi:hypothetical protein